MHLEFLLVKILKFIPSEITSLVILESSFKGFVISTVYVITARNFAVHISVVVLGCWLST